MSLLTAHKATSLLEQEADFVLGEFLVGISYSPRSTPIVVVCLRGGLALLPVAVGTARLGTLSLLLFVGTLVDHRLLESEARKLVEVNGWVKERAGQMALQVRG